MFCEWHRKLYSNLHSDEGCLLFSPVRPGMCFSKKRDSVLQRGSQGVTGCWSGLESHTGKNEIYQLHAQQENLFLHQRSELLSSEQNVLYETDAYWPLMTEWFGVGP